MSQWASFRLRKIKASGVPSVGPAGEIGFAAPPTSLAGFSRTRAFPAEVFWPH